MKKLHLSDIPKQDPFAVPEGYIAGLPRQIQDRIYQQERQYSQDALPLFGILPRFQLVYSLLVLLFAITISWMLPVPGEALNASTLLEQTSEQEVVSYLNTYARLSQQELISLARWDEAAASSSQIDFPSAEVLEDEILQDLDKYTAEELWK